MKNQKTMDKYIQKACGCDAQLHHRHMPCSFAEIHIENSTECMVVSKTKKKNPNIQIPNWKHQNQSNTKI